MVLPRWCHVCTPKIQRSASALEYSTCAEACARVVRGDSLSPNHLCNLFNRFKDFAVTIKIKDDKITSIDLINYRSSLNRRDEWYLGAISGLLKKWHAMCIPGVSDDAVQLLENIRIKGNLKGEAVQTMDPEQGRFTDIELESICSALKRAYETTCAIEIEDYALALLSIALGPRPVQYAAMKVCDLAVNNGSEGPQYVLSVPRAKRRESMPRSSFKKRILIPEIGRVVFEHSIRVKREFAHKMADTNYAPMFPSASAQVGADGFEYHRTSNELSAKFRNTMKELCIHSERTGDLLNINATRFRRTLACRAADEGHGELVIADLLDHTDTQNVGVYIEASPGMMERIDRAVALRLAPLAQAFAGVIITDESQARRAGDPTSRIIDPRFGPTINPIGNCGQFGFCGALAPIACYTCLSFEPWLDGPHERVLDFLIAERDRLLSETDKRIASINDRTILAVADVVRRCAEIKKEKKQKEEKKKKAPNG
jgi:integrase